MQPWPCAGFVLALGLGRACRFAGAARVDAALDLASEAASNTTAGRAEGILDDDDDVACYCKTVQAVSDCKDNKYRDAPWRPSGPRYFHAAAPGEDREKHLCCKLTASVFGWAGWSYSKQDDLSLCAAEVRPVPADKCCRLQDEHGSFGVRVSRVSSEARTKPKEQTRVGTRLAQYGKSPPSFRLEDLLGGEDYTGEALPAETVRKFVELQLEAGRFGRQLQCGGVKGSVDGLLADGAACRLREGPAQQCCCEAVTLVEAERCLPANGAATEEAAAPRVLESKVREHKEHGYRRGEVLHQPGPDPEAGLQAVIEELADPEQEDHPETEADESSKLFTWLKADSQWRRTCVEEQPVAHVVEHQKVVRKKDGKSCRTVRVGMTSRRVCKTKYKNVVEYSYSQGFENGCVKWRWERRCPAGTGRFFKRIEPGACMGEGEGLEPVGSLVHECPAHYRSGLGGAAKFSRLCRCKAVCG